jgi:hypothetical protein
MRETWYVLEDGRAVDPAEVAPAEGGRLVHTSGALVAMRGDVPSSRSIDPEQERAKYTTRDMQAAPARGYKTRKA